MRFDNLLLPFLGSGVTEAEKHAFSYTIKETRITSMNWQLVHQQMNTTIQVMHNVENKS